jgi:uncharacterized protein (DUF1330 family)
MPKGYWVTTYRSIKDPAKVQAYAALAGPAMTKYGCRYLCRGPEYQKALQVLGDGAVRDMRLVDGVE